MRLRLVRVVLSTGCTEVLITSLLDTVAYPVAAALCTEAHARLEADKAEHYRVKQALAIKHWPDLAVAWIKGGADLLQQKLEAFVVILTASLDKLRPGRSCPRNFGVNGAQRPRRAYQ